MKLSKADALIHERYIDEYFELVPKFKGYFEARILWHGRVIYVENNPDKLNDYPKDILRKAMYFKEMCL